MTTISQLPPHRFYSAQEIAQMRDGKETGKGAYQCKCPAHEDRVASLSVGTGRNGDTLINCQAGCDKRDVVKALGLEWKNLFREPRSNGQSPYRATASPVATVLPIRSLPPKEREPSAVEGMTHPTLGKPDAVYPYYDDQGNVRYISARFGKPEKTFRQASPDGRGGWSWSLREVEPLPFRLSEVIEAIACEKQILIPEGEKDVIRLESLGFIATTNSGGAGKFPASATKYFEGADVVVLADNDEPGRKHAHAVADLLHPIAASVKVVELNGIPEKGDVSDWLDAGHSSDDLRAVIEKAPRWKEQPTEDALPRAICALNAPPAEPIEWVVDGLLIAGELGLWAGDGGSFKSTINVHIACAVAGGYRVFGHFETKQGAAFIVSEEDSAGVLRNRAEAIIRGQGWDRQRVLSNLHFMAQEGVSLSSSTWCNHLLAEVTRLNAKFICLDPLYELVEGEENSSTDMRPVIKAARSLARVTGASASVVHHAGKMTQGKRTKDRIRGSSAFYGAARAAFIVEDKHGEKAISVECVKLSRTAMPDPFMVRFYIESDPANRASWLSARFEYASVREVKLDTGTQFDIDQLALSGRMSTTDLKNAAKEVEGVSGQDVSTALKWLEQAHRIDFNVGGQNKKLWGLISLPEPSRQARQALDQPSLSLPGKVEACHGNPPEPPKSLPAPFRGQAFGQGSGASASSPNSIVGEEVEP